MAKGRAAARRVPARKAAHDPPAHQHKWRDQGTTEMGGGEYVIEECPCGETRIGMQLR